MLFGDLGLHIVTNSDPSILSVISHVFASTLPRSRTHSHSVPQLIKVLVCIGKGRIVRMSLNTNAAGGAGGDARVGVGVGAGAFALCAAAVLLWNKNQKKNSSSDCRGGGRGRGSVDSGKREKALLEDTSW
jgi:hypothetical protein